MTRSLRALSLASAILVVAATGLVLSPRAAASAIAIASEADGGYDHACAVSSGQIFCWGRNTYGQLGNGTNTDSSTPVVVSGVQTWASVSVGNYFACAVTTGGAAYCWGRGSNGQLGNNFNLDSTTPVAVAGGHTWLSVSAGAGHVCGLESGGGAYCWGADWYGQLGDAANSEQDNPTLVAGSHTWTSVNAGIKSSCGIVTGGAAYCWGEGGNGTLGDGSFSHDSNLPVAVVGSHIFSSIEVGDEAVCGIDTGGAAYCWGRNDEGALGDGTTTHQHSPTAVLGGALYISIDTEYGTTCAVTSTHVAQCWGTDALGALGVGGSANVSSPVNVSGGYLASSVTLTGGGACLRTTLNLVYCWGYGTYGTLGNGGNANVNVPVGVLGFANLANNSVVSVSVDPSLTFVVAALASACNGEGNFANVGTATAVPLAHLAAGANVSGGQTLTAMGNSGAGFSVYVRGTQSANNLRSGSHNWTDVAGTYATPAALGSGERFGFTYKDSTSSSSVTNPGSALFVALDTTNRAVMGSSSSASGSGCISFDAQTSASTPAASYSATVFYVAVPAF